MILPESAPVALPKFGSVIVVLELAYANGARLVMLKMLKKFALISKFAPSPKKPGIPNRFARLRSTWRYFGPRNELRPMPGVTLESPGTPAGPSAPTVEKHSVPTAG